MVSALGSHSVGPGFKKAQWSHNFFIEIESSLYLSLNFFDI